MFKIVFEEGEISIVQDFDHFLTFNRESDGGVFTLDNFGGEHAPGAIDG
jgi:hypothetical protein